MNVLYNIKKSIRFLKKLKKYQSKSYTPRYKVINVYKDKSGKFSVALQVIGKSVVYQYYPVEILSDDNFVDFLSPHDVRTLTYLGYLENNQPEYKLLAKRLSEHNQEIFVLEKRGENKPIHKTAEEISNSDEIINSMSSKDANRVGYTVATMQILEEQDLKNSAINELYFQKEFSKKVIRVGSPADYPPFAYINNNNEYDGLEVEIVRDIFDKLKVKFEFVKTTWSDLHDDLLANKFDMAIGGISLTTERQKFLHSHSVMQSGKTLLTIRKYENSIKSFADIDKPGVIVIENRGGTNEQFAKMHIKNAKIVIVENNCEIFERLATGEFDFMFTDLPEALYRAGLDSRIVIAKPLQIYTTPLAYGFIYTHQSTVLRNCINIYVQKLVGSAKINDIKQKYFKMELNTNE